MSIRPTEYISDKHIIGINTTKVWNTLGSGLSTMSGSLLRLAIKPVNSTGGVGGTGPKVPTEIHVVMVSDNVVEVKDSGVQIFG